MVVKLAKLSLILIATVIILTVYAPFLLAEPQSSWYIPSLNINAIDKHVSYLSSLRSRFTGYPGYYNATQYIYNYLVSLGLNVKIEEYEVVVPIEEYAYLTLSDKNKTKLTLHMLFPAGIDAGNAFNVTGKLVYVGKGELEELDGKEINGSIVLIDYFSSWNWRLLPMLGAKAIIFVNTGKGEGLIPRIASEYKIVSIPTGYIRLYADFNETQLLIEACKKGLNATINAKMTWKKVKAYNIWTIIEGSDPRLKNEYIAFFAHYDTFSVVPAVAPGASDTISIGILLELARVLSENPPPRSVVIVALGGHWQYLAGARYFTEYRLRELENGKGIMKKIKLAICIDISTAGNALSLRNFGCGYWYIDTMSGMLVKYSWIKSTADEAVRELSSKTGLKFNFVNALIAAPPGQGLRLTLLTLLSSTGDIFPAMFDMEPWTMAGGLGIAFRTSWSYYPYLTTPLDTYNKLDYVNLRPQLMVFEAIISKLLSIERWNPLATPSYRRIIQPDLGLCRLKVRIYYYDIKTAKYYPVKNAIVWVMLSSPSPESVRIFFPYLPYGITDENGTAEFVGLRYNDRIFIEAFSLDERGNIVGYSPYSGPGETRATNIIYSTDMEVLQSLTYNVSRIVIPCFRLTTASYGILNVLYPLDSRSHYLIKPYSFTHVSDLFDEVVYVQSNTPVELVVLRIIAFTGPLGRIFAATVQAHGIIAGINKPAQEGPGFMLKPGEKLTLHYFPLRLATETYYLNQYRLAPVEWANVSAQAMALFFHNLAEEEISLARSHLRNKTYSKAIIRSFLAELYAINAYDATRAFLMDVLQMAVIYFLIVLPFSWLLVNLVFRERASTKKKALLFFATSLILYLIFIVIHPTTMLATNMFMVLAGYIAMTLGLITVVMVLSKGYGQLRELRRERIGIHFAEFERTSAIGAAVNLSLGHMNRRPLRTILTLISVIIVGFSTLTFSSLSITAAAVTVPIPPLKNIPYHGVLYKGEVIPLDQAEALIQLFKDEAIISVRAWLYPPGGEMYLKNKTLVRGILAVSPEEKEFTGIDKALISGEWFDPWDYKVCFISEYMAKKMGVEEGDTIDILGIKLVVKGIFDGKYLDTLRDIDRMKITPIYVLSQYREPTQGDFVIIIPYRLAKDLIPVFSGVSLEYLYITPGIKSIVMKPKDGDVKRLAREVALATRGIVYVAEDGNTYRMSINPGIKLLGTGEAIVVIALAVLVLLSTILGSIIERMREIGILSAIGLSPSHIASLYLVEMVVYGVMGCVLGYVLSLLFTATISILNIPTLGLYSNYTSSGTLLAMLIIFISILMVALYPTYKASRLVTPSLERKWKPPTKPKGDEWFIPLPLRLADKIEALAFLEFIKEYFEYRKAERVGKYQILDLGYEFDEKREVYALKSRAQLAPWDQGISEIIILRGICIEGGYNFELYLKRLTGPLAGWIISNRFLLEDVRFQILMWRSLGDRDRMKYINRAKKVLSGGES